MAPSIKLLYVSELNQIYTILGPEMSILFYFMCYYVHTDKCTDMNCKPFFCNQVPNAVLFVRETHNIILL